MKKERLLELAGVTESLEDAKQKLAQLIFAKAEEMAFAESEEGKRAVTGDMVHSYTKILMDDIMQRVEHMITMKA